MTQGRLVVKPLFGLGNRMLAIAAASRVARKLGYTLGVEWVQNGEMISPIQDLFQNGEGLLPRPYPDEGYKNYDLFRDQLFILDHDDVARRDAVRITAYCPFFLSSESFDHDKRVFGNNVFFQDMALDIGDCLRELTLAEDIRAQIAAYDDVDFSNVVGVHIRNFDRRSDTWGIEDIDSNRWRGLCLDLLTLFPWIRIFLSSNSEEDYAFFDSCAKGRVFYHPKSSLDRSHRESQKDAAVDMTLLGRTCVIIRHCMSTFAYGPALAGQVPQFIIRGDATGAVEGVLCDIDAGARSFVMRDWKGLGEKLAALPRSG